MLSYGRLLFEIGNNNPQPLSPRTLSGGAGVLKWSENENE